MPVHDTLFTARARNPELPKGLKAVGTELTDIHHWETTSKGEKAATSVAVTDMERLVYCVNDVVVNSRIKPALDLAAHNRGYFRPLPEELRPRMYEGRDWNLHEVDHETQHFCREMHLLGCPVHQPTVAKIEKQYRRKVEFLRRELQEQAHALGFGRVDLDSGEQENEDGPPINPGSYGQIRELLYDRLKLGCPPGLKARDFFTKSDLPGTGDHVLRAHLARKDVSDLLKAFIWNLRLERRFKNKGLSAGVMRAKRRDQHEKGWTDQDDRIRGSWNAHVPAVARLACSKPNMMNQSGKGGLGDIKKMYAVDPRSGRYLLGADLDQAHLRIIANYWMIKVLRKAFLEGIDAHGSLANTLSDGVYLKVPEWSDKGPSLMWKPKGGKAHALRQTSKIYRYAYAYWAEDPTILRVMQATESARRDANGKVVKDQFGLEVTELPYLNFSLPMISKYRQLCERDESDWEPSWRWMLKLYDENGGWMEDPIFRRRSGVLSGGKKNEVVNNPILTAESALMRLAEAEVRLAFPFEGRGAFTGVVAQVHDSMKVEWSGGMVVPRRQHPVTRKLLTPNLPYFNDDYEWCNEVESNRLKLEEAMTVRIPGHDILYTAEAKVGLNFKDVD